MITRVPRRRAMRRRLLAAILCVGITSGLRGQQIGAAVSPAQYTQAETLLRGGRWDEGLSFLTPLTQSNPQDLRILNLMGLALTGAGKPAQADDYFLRCLQLSPNFFAALKNLGINEFSLQQDAAAEQHLLAAVQQAANDKVIHLYLGRLAYNRKEFARSAEMLTLAGDLVSKNADVTAQLAVSKLATADPASALPLLNRIPPEKLHSGMQFALGLALLQAGEVTQALSYLQAVQQANPHGNEINFDLAICDLKAKNYGAAIATVKVLIADGFETSEVNNILAEAYEASGSTQPAIDALRRAIALDPKEEQNYLDFASICLNHQAYEEALKVLNAGLSQHPKADKLLFERGIVYALQDHIEFAERDFDAASTMAPETDLGAIGLGVTYLETGNSKEAVVLLRKKLVDHPRDAHLLYLLGEALIRSGATMGDATYTEAQRSLEQALQIDLHLGLAHVSLGRMYLEQARNADAVEQLEMAREILPNERSVYSHLAIAYRRLGRADEAKSSLSTLRQINDRNREAVMEKSAGQATVQSVP